MGVQFSAPYFPSWEGDFCGVGSAADNAMSITRSERGFAGRRFFRVQFSLVCVTMQHMEQDVAERFTRIEDKLDTLSRDVADVRESVAKLIGASPYFATKEDVEAAKHEATRSR